MILIEFDSVLGWVWSGRQEFERAGVVQRETERDSDARKGRDMKPERTTQKDRERQRTTEKYR